MKTKIVSWILVIVLLLVPTTAVFAKDPPPPDEGTNLTNAQMKSAAWVKDGTVESRANVKGKVFRLESCDENASKDAPCYVSITGGGQQSNVITPLSTTSTLVCGINISNRIGSKLGRLQENVNITFSGATGKTPLTMNWGDLRGTAALPGYTWGSTLSGPTPNPNWGQSVSQSGRASAISSGILYLAIEGFPLQAYASIRMIITSSGWWCE
jgi:hypothetical protein